MIAQLRGVLIEKHPQQAVVECGGVGYDVAIPVSTYTALPDVGQEVRLRIHTNVREDAIQLFGFASAGEKELFERLISVSGIGPKLANTVLSGVQAAELKVAIRSGDVQRLTRVPGIGKKTAERMVLELRDKIDAVAAAAGPKGGMVSLAGTDTERDVVSALVNLGSQPGAAEAAVRKAVESGVANEFEPLFRKALEVLR
jgi:Holliday junction DNA helicase RuvA